jgi:hypothetical protein
MTNTQRGTEPTGEEWDRIEARIESTGGLIRATIMRLLKEKAEGE